MCLQIPVYFFTMQYKTNITWWYFTGAFISLGTSSVRETGRHGSNTKKKSTVRSEPIKKATNETLLCVGKKNGLYIGGCTSFYRCKDEETEHVPCPVDLVVNELYMYCD